MLDQVVCATCDGEVFDAGHLVGLAFGWVRKSEAFPGSGRSHCGHIAPRGVGEYVWRLDGWQPAVSPVDSIIPHVQEFRPSGGCRARSRTTCRKRHRFPVKCHQWGERHSSSPGSRRYAARVARSCVARLILRSCEEHGNGAGIRQAGRRGPMVGKDLLYGCTG